MQRWSAARWAALAWSVGSGCGGKDDGGDGDSGEAPEIPLSTVAGEIRGVDVRVTNNSCDDDLEDALDELDLRVSQVSTGLSVFVYEDLGWVPCDGSVQSFDCRWGDAPGDTPGGQWSWRFWGAAVGGAFDAQLSLTVTCDGQAFGCDACEIVADVTGTFEPDPG